MAKWIGDPAHSEIGFKVKHLMITNVAGSFKEYVLEVTTKGEDFVDPRIHFTAKSGSIETGDSQRDQHLRSADFFDSETYPEIKFISTGYERQDEESYELFGDLTIKNITKPVKLDVEFAGIVKDPFGNTKAGFVVSGKIDRKEWNLNWNAALGAGGLLVSDDVRVVCEIQLIKTADQGGQAHQEEAASARK